MFLKNNYNKKILTQTEIGVCPDSLKRNDNLRQGFREKHGLDECFVIGFAGRIVNEKGIYDLSKATNLLRNELNIKVVWAGDGREISNLKKINERDIFLGQLTMDEMLSFYNGIDCMVLPSKTTDFWEEQFGLVIPQALATGTPVIGSTSGAIPEVIGNNEYIFEEGNVEHLVSIIRRVYSGELSSFNKGERYYTTTMAKELVSFLASLKQS